MTRGPTFPPPMARGIGLAGLAMGAGAALALGSIWWLAAGLLAFALLLATDRT